MREQMNLQSKVLPSIIGMQVPNDKIINVVDMNVYFYDLEIRSNIKEITKTSFFMSQKVFKDNDQITEAEVHLVTIDKKGKPVKIPETLKEELEKLI